MAIVWPEAWTWLGLETAGVLAPDPEGQELPALPLDRTTAPTVRLALDTPAPRALVTPAAAGHVIANGRRAVRLPPDGPLQAPLPGPLAGVALDGAWYGALALETPLAYGRAETRIEAHGDHAIQWATTLTWGGGGRLTWRVRWANGSDTLIVVAETARDEDGALIWQPFGATPAAAWVEGGGERPGPMQPPALPALPGAISAPGGNRLLATLGHLSYFNQWQQAWAGFTAPGDARFLGVFTGWAHAWQRRGHGRLELRADAHGGHYLRFPLRRGRRCFGLVLTSQAEADIADPARRCLLNRRKLQHSDFAPRKTAAWLLTPPLPPPTSRLLPPLTGEETLDGADLRTPEALREEAARTRDHARLGGYECLIIFDGRRAKSYAYDFAFHHARGALDDATARDLLRGLLLLAYVFADPDYCAYGDFWPHREPADEGIVTALAEELGDCPVPPNFASEFFATTGLVAELLPEHPQAPAWRAWAAAQTYAFLDTFFAADGTYAESINYHSHALNELLCYWWPLARHGGPDFFADPRVQGSFRHFVQLQMPHLESHGCAPLPANGNSGGKGREQPCRTDLVVGAVAYRERDPDLAAQLRHAWEAGGRPCHDAEHALLTALLIPAMPPPAPPPWRSVHRQTLGLVAKAFTRDGAPLYALLRAGRATHHMDFDQGHLHLAAWGRVLLGDHGYHTWDDAGPRPHAAATWLHSTLTYGPEADLASGYTGLELAPEPLCVHAGDASDYLALRLVNTNYRHLGALRYRDLVPAPTTVHVRQVVFVKPDYFIVRDTLLVAAGPATWRLQPHAAPRPVGPHAWRTGLPGEPHLALQLLAPATYAVTLNRQVGPWWSFALTAPTGAPFLALLVPQRHERGLVATQAEDGTLTISGDGLHDTLRLPPPDAPAALPTLYRA